MKTLVKCCVLIILFSGLVITDLPAQLKLDSHQTVFDDSVYGPMFRDYMLPPDDITITSAPDGTISLSWMAIPGVESYVVESSADPASGFVDVSVLGIFTEEAMTVIWTAAAAETLQFYRVRSKGIATYSKLNYVEGGFYDTSGVRDLVEVAGFWIDCYEVMQYQYSYVMGSNPSAHANQVIAPVEMVSWFDAITYCNRRSYIEGLIPCYSFSTYGSNPANWPLGWGDEDLNAELVSCNWTANGYRLPSTIEWRFAASGGNLTHHYTYSGSSTIGDVAWYMGNSGTSTHDIECLASNELGLYDMSGNVAEWCWDSEPNPGNPERRYALGGSWYSMANNCTVNASFTEFPSIRDPGRGFRVCRGNMDAQSLVFVQGGTFHNGFADVTLSSFYMDKFELTQGKWEAIMGTNPTLPQFGIGNDNPVTFVNWFEAIEYCNRRSYYEGLTPCYSYLDLGTNTEDWPDGWQIAFWDHANILCNWSANGYRLPTEMEWIYAAKGVAMTPATGYNTYSGTNDLAELGDFAWYNGNLGTTSGGRQVGLKQPNELGLYDMSGNVCEMVWDKLFDPYGSHPTYPQTDPHGPDTGSQNRIRHGGWYGGDPWYCEVLVPQTSTLTFRHYMIGFRVCRAAQSFVYVEGGTFNNGVANITVSPFWIDRFETTQSSYRSIMNSNPSNFPDVQNGPVEWVTWFKALEYCNRRSMQEGLVPCYSYGTYGSNPNNWPANWASQNEAQDLVTCDWNASGYRLPTEAEWQFAAIGGVDTQNNTYSGSNDIEAVAWHAHNSTGTPHSVGTKLPNELGIFDMSGNAWEWVWDRAGELPGIDQTNPTGPSTGANRVIHGGTWFTPPNFCSPWHRITNFQPEGTCYPVGFRICRKAI
jgi:formylglycine-generating enzyme required for sulfatase activity